MRMAIKWIFLLVILLLVGCSSTPSIYLNERYLTDEDIISVSTMLSEQGFSVKVVDIPFPNNVTVSTVMYSPLLSVETTLDTVLKTLEQEGYSSLSVIPLKQGKHLYKQNSVGLYLLPPGIKSLAASDQNFAHHYHSEGCHSESFLQLKRDKTFIYEIDENQLFGRWEIPDIPYLRLYSRQPYINFYYRISTDTRSDNLGEVDIITLTPMSQSSGIVGCQMLYGVRH